MRKAYRTLGALVCLLFVLSLLATPAWAKGVSGGAKGFSSGGRSSFSSGAKGAPSAGKGYTSGGSGYSSKPAGSGKSSAAPAAPKPSTGSGAGKSSATANPYGKGYTTETRDYSTPRTSTPPALATDYSTGQGGFSTAQPGYGTSRPSYNGTWDRTQAGSGDRYPDKPPVGVFGAPPLPPPVYHNTYWGLPWWMHLFFQPNYYHTPWGYSYFAPRLLTWFILASLLAAGAYLLYRRHIGRGYGGM